MFRQLCWFIWIGGTALILLSWTGAVSPTVGWIGFGVACAAALITYLPQKHIPPNQDWALLTTDMIDRKDHRYDSVMEHIRSGRPAWYDGIGISLRPRDEFALAIVPSVPIRELDEELVMRDVARAKSVLEKLLSASPELTEMASTRTLRVSVLSEYSQRAFEVCRIINDSIEWKAKDMKPEGT
jgi:hypothetical protein